MNTDQEALRIEIQQLTEREDRLRLEQKRIQSTLDSVMAQKNFLCHQIVLDVDGVELTSGQKVIITEEAAADFRAKHFFSRWREVGTILYISFVHLDGDITLSDTPSGKNSSGTVRKAAFVAPMRRAYLEQHNETQTHTE